jgi:hypothetical protein
MIKDLGDVGTYTIVQERLVLKTPGRKFSPRRDSKTHTPHDYYLHDFDPKTAKIGDIVDVGHYRKENSYIVTLDHNKRFILVRLPDEGHSGYGTIPLTISSFFKNAIDAYQDIDDIQYIHLSPSDKGLKKYFFHEKSVPRKYTYRYHTSSDEVEVSDPQTQKTVSLDRSGKKLGSYLTSMLKENKTKQKEIRLLVRFEYSPKRKTEIQKLSFQRQTNPKTQQKYRTLRQKYSHEARQFRERKETQLDDLFIKNKLSAEYDGGGGGSYKSYTYYHISGSKTNVDKTLKVLSKLDQTNDVGTYTVSVSS